MQKRQRSRRSAEPTVPEKTEQERQSDPSPGADSYKPDELAKVNQIIDALASYFPQLAALNPNDYTSSENLAVASDEFSDSCLGSGAQGTILKATVLPFEREFVAVKVGKSSSILEEFMQIRSFNHPSTSLSPHGEFGGRPAGKQRAIFGIETPAILRGPPRGFFCLSSVST